VKLGAKASESAPALPIGEEDENARRSAASAGADGTPLFSQNEPTPLHAPADLPPAEEHDLLAKFLIPGESVLWKRSFSKGIIRRHLTYTEVVTNLRAVCIDDERLILVRYAQVRQCEVSVENERRIYSGVHTGYSHSGVYGGISSGQSEMFGNVNFIQDGRIVLTLYNVNDPNGLKELVLAAKNSQR